MFKVTVDDEVIEQVSGWSTSGNVLILELNDGSWRGFTGFVDFRVERIAQ